MLNSSRTIHIIFAKYPFSMWMQELILIYLSLIMIEEQYDYVFKFILIGNGNCGKTSLLYYYVNGKPKQKVSQTVGVEFATKSISIKQKQLKLQLWDTAGQERFRSITKTYYRGALGALIVFDITNKDTFDALNQWIKDAREFAKPSIQIMVIGNKLDEEQNRAISFKDASDFCKQNDVMYMETSALNGQFVKDAFTKLALRIIELIDNKVFSNETIKPRFLTSKQEEKPTCYQKC
ncbi:hypothetical protein pb186bvf_006916 [Paramecium bursaria]